MMVIYIECLYLLYTLESVVIVRAPDADTIAHAQIRNAACSWRTGGTRSLFNHYDNYGYVNVDNACN